MLHIMAVVIVIIRHKMGHETESTKLHFVTTAFSNITALYLWDTKKFLLTVYVKTF